MLLSHSDNIVKKFPFPVKSPLTISIIFNNRVAVSMQDCCKVAVGKTAVGK